MIKRESIFRKTVTDRLSVPDEFTEPVTVIRAADWLLLAAVGMVLGSVFLWSLVSRIPVRVEARGLVGPARQTVLTAPGEATVSRICVGSGMAETGAVLIELSPDKSEPNQRKIQPRSCAEIEQHSSSYDVVAPYRARIAEVLVVPGEHVSARSDLVVLEPAEPPPNAVVLVQRAMADRITIGAPVALRPNGASPGHYRQVLGRVSKIARSPISNAGLVSLLQQSPLVQDCIVLDLRIRVDVILDDSVTWEDDNGPAETTLQEGLPLNTPVEGQIFIGRERPIAWLFRRSW